MFNKMRKPTRAQDLVRLAALILAGLCVVCGIVAVVVSAYRDNRGERHYDLREEQLREIVDYLEFNGLDQTVQDKMQLFAQEYTDFSNFVVTNADGSILYSMNQGHLDGSGSLTVCTDGMQYLYITDKEGKLISRHYFRTDDITPLVVSGSNRYKELLKSFGVDAEGMPGVTIVQGEAWASGYSVVDGTYSYNSGYYSENTQQIFYAGFPSKGMDMFFFYDQYSEKWEPNYSTDGTRDLVRVIAAVGMSSWVFYWAATAIWIFLDARRRDNHPALWGVLALFTNIVGLIVYLAVRRDSAQCPNCKEPLEAGFVVCPVCGTQSHRRCANCQCVLQDHWAVCPRCGKAAEGGAEETHPQEA